MCDKCFSELAASDYKEVIEGIEIGYFYPYNEKFKTMLYHLKGLGDIELATLFLERQRLFLKVRYFNYILVPAPSTSESDTARGFNHVNEIFKGLGLKIMPLIKKSDSFKQSDLDFHKRQEVAKKLYIENGELLQNKKVLIVDDIKTTGATIKAMINLIKPFHPQKLKVFTLAATKPNTIAPYFK